MERGPSVCLRQRLRQFGGSLEADLFTQFDDERSFVLSTKASLDEDIVPPHPSQRSCLPSLDMFEHAGPLIITPDPRAAKQVVETDEKGHVPLIVPVAVDSSVFKGVMRSVFKGCPGTPEAEFKGSKVMGKSILQGMFKVPTAAKDLWVGQELLNRPILPTSFQRLMFTSAAKMFSSTYQVMVEGDGDTVGYQNPLLAVAATINVSRPGQQPSLSNIHEDARLLDARLTDKCGRAVPGHQRQRFFDRPSNMEGVVFDTENVYTFVLCQSIMDMPSYRMKLGFINLDMCSVLNGQPLQMSCKNLRTNETVMSMLVWHKHLNYPSSRLRTPRSSASISSTSHTLDYRHCRTGSNDSSSSSSSSSSSCGTSCPYSSSSGNSLSSTSSSGCTSLLGEDTCSALSTECDDCCSEADFHSCVDETDEFQSSLVEDSVADGLPQMQQQQLVSPAEGKSAPPAESCQLPMALEPAFSAPAHLYSSLDDSQDSCDHVPVQVTVISSSTGLLRAVSRRGSSNSGNSAKPKRQSTGDRAAAAVFSAARRITSRLRKSQMGADL